MSVESTIVSVVTSESTVVTISNTESSILNTSNAESTILTAAPSTITLPTIANFSDEDPLELADSASAGVSNFASRADHQHPTTGMTLSGGNF